MKNPSDPYNLGALANDPFDAQSGGVALSVVAVEHIPQDVVVRVRQALTNAEPACESAPGRPTPAVLTGGTQAPGSDQREFLVWLVVGTDPERAVPADDESQRCGPVRGRACGV